MKQKQSTPRGYTRPELAAALKCARATIERLIEAGLEPIGRRGRAHVYRVVDARRLRRELTRRDRQGGDATLLRERVALIRARRRKLEQETRIHAGEYVLATDVQAEYSALATVVKAQLRAIPDAVADQVVAAAKAGPASVKTLLLARIDDALRELAGRGQMSDLDTCAWLAAEMARLKQGAPR